MARPEGFARIRTRYKDSSMKICIYGAGAIGGWMGARLAQAGHDVSVIARGATLSALRENGLQLVEGGKTTAATVEASEHSADLGPQDIVIVAVKAPAMAAVAAGIAPLLTENTTIITAMNGIPWWFCDGLGAAFAGTQLTSVDPGGAIAAAIPSVQTVGCVVHASCLQDAPSVIRHHQGNGLILGEASGQPSERVAKLVETFAAAGFNASASDQIQRDVWYKLWGNMTMNPISAITGATTDKILGDDLVRGFVTRAMLEAKEIGARFGIVIDQQPSDRHAVTLKLGAMKTSMLQDVLARKTVEIDALVGAVRELGQITDVPTPFIDALLGLARLHARTLGLY
jgi:2-dehydropantoate 2-reductase